MVLSPDDGTAARLREELVTDLVEEGRLTDPGWREAVRRVPRHLFVPGFYARTDRPDDLGLPVWEPVTAEIDRDRWLTAAYSNTTLLTQFDEIEPDWSAPTVRHGGFPTSSSTLPSLVAQMWEDADVNDGHTVLEIGTGTGYSTALACEYLGSVAVTSIDVDVHRMEQAASALFGLGYSPTLVVADGIYGYWPEAPFDRIVAACSFRSVPHALVAQTRPGGKILLTLSGWLYGYARVLLTVDADGNAEGPLLPGTVSFMSARTHEPPAFGNPAHWSNRLTDESRTTEHDPGRITEGNVEGFHLRFLVQCATPDAQMTVPGDTIDLVDVTTGSVASLAREDDGWQVRERGPVKLWERVEALVTAYDAAGRPAPETFRLTVTPDGQYLRHPDLPALALPS